MLVGSAERLPFDEDSFDAALAQLVVQFMDDPVVGVAEMAAGDAAGRRRGGVRLGLRHRTCSPQRVLDGAALAVDPSLKGERDLAGVAPGQLTRIFEEAGWIAVEESEVAVTLELGDFDAWWQPMTLGVGPAGSWLAAQPAEVQAVVRERCRELYPDAPGIGTAFVWAARGRAPG